MNVTDVPEQIELELEAILIDGIKFEPTVMVTTFDDAVELAKQEALLVNTAEITSLFEGVNV